MLKKYLYKIVSIFIVSLFVVNIVNAQFDPNSFTIEFTGGGQDNISGLEESIDRSPIIDTVSLTNNDITDVFRIITSKTDWSIIPTSEVSKTKVNLFAQEITAKALFDTIIQITGFIYHKEGNIITVMTYDEYAQFYGLEKKVITLDYADADSIATVIKTFMTSKVGKSIVHQETNSIVLLESEANLDTIIDIIDQLDIPSDSEIAIKVIDLVYMDVEEVANTLQSIFNEQEEDQVNKRKQTSEPSGNQLSERITVSEARTEGSISTPYSNVGIYPLSSSNKLIVKASKSDLEDIEELIKTLDVFIEPITQTYHFTYIEASDIYSDLENILDIRTGNNMYSRGGGQNRREGGRPGGLTLVEKTNTILLTGPPSVHRVMDSIVKEVDVQSRYETGEIRRYRLNNADLEEVAATIRELIQSKQREEGRTGESRFKTLSESTPDTSGNLNLSETEEYIPQIEATVAVNQSTNSIIIRATARQHREFEKLIKELDKRQRQVQIKAMIIEVTTNDDTDFGIEVDYINRDTINFSSFGLSTIDPATGIRDIIVSPGGTAAVLNPGNFQAILKAVKGNDNIRIESSPQLLVNDNAEGIIQSIAEQPTRQTNQGENTTVTSFGEYVSAGTQFYVTPHISEYDYLQVKYEIVLNSFGEQAASDLPPARSTSTIQSKATVPNGYTIVVGGIQSTKDSESVDKIPLLGNIPILGMLFRNTVIRKQNITTYLFITTTIIESDDFTDIRDISNEILNQMGKEGNNITDPNEENAQTE